MKAFADKFEDTLAASLPLLSLHHADVPQGLLGAKDKLALAYQRAVCTAMKRDQDDLRSSVDKPAQLEDLESIIAALQNLQVSESVATCITVPLSACMQGPKHVAELIMAEERKQERILNEEQKMLFALWVDKLQQAFEHRPDTQKPDIPLDTYLFDIIVDGGGGCGKTMLINHFLVPLCRAFFGTRGVVLAAPSNKAARGIGAKTVHSLLGFTPAHSLRTAALALTTQKRVKLECTFLPAGAMLHDESSMLAGSMNHAASLVATYAREYKFRLRRENYAMPRERYGGIPVLGFFGDHLQLPPVPKANSMLAPLDGTSQEHRVGTSIFRQARYVFQLQQMMRFKDPTLVRILHTMRTVGGQALAETDWQSLLETELRNDTCSADKPVTTNSYHTSYVWSVVSMAAFVIARESARTAQKTLFYAQAVDTCLNPMSFTTQQKQKLYHAFLRVSSLTKTKILAAFCLFHVDMEVRLTTTLEVPFAVQDATGTVVEIQFDKSEPYLKHRREPELQNLEPEILLHTLPTAVLIKLHGCKQIFLPVQPCANCSTPTLTCLSCTAKRKTFEGVFAVEPIARKWIYDGPELDGQFANVHRRQIPLAPAKVLPLYSMQGLTALPGLVAHWIVPARLPSDIKWLICYVTLSRVPSLKQLVSIGLSEKIRQILESGPPEGVVQMFSSLFAQKIEDTRAAAKEASERLGW